MEGSGFVKVIKRLRDNSNEEENERQDKGYTEPLICILTLTTSNGQFTTASVIPAREPLKRKRSSFFGTPRFSNHDYDVNEHKEENGKVEVRSPCRSHLTQI